MDKNRMYPRLLGDVGGTHARFGWQDGAGSPLTHVLRLKADEHAGLAQAIEAYLAQAQLPRPVAACLGMANPLTGDQVRMTNRDWSFSAQALKQQLGLYRLKLINDFTALAWALPSLPDHALVPVGGPATAAPAALAGPKALIGPGTGLGVSGLLPTGDGRWVPVAGEGGHVTLAAHTDLEWRLIERIRQQHGHVSAERVLSGPGLANLHAALQDEWGGARPTTRAPLTAPQITALALQQRDPLALQCLELFCGFLGSVAGDLALTLGAQGGVYIGGGVVPHLLGWMEGSGFRARFEAKGRFADYLRDIPVWVINAPESPALWGAALALDQAH